MRLLIEGGYYLFRVRAMIDTEARMRYVRLQGNAHPMNLSRARLLFEGGSYFSAQALRAATIRGAAIIRINTVYYT